MYKIVKFIPLLIIICTFFAGCDGAVESESTQSPYPVNIKNITLYGKPDRIVSLSDEITQILIEEGFREQILGLNSDTEITEMENLPQVGTSYAPKAEAINDLSPELLITDYPISAEVLEIIGEQEIKVLVLSEDDDMNYSLALLNGKAVESSENE